MADAIQRLRFEDPRGRRGGDTSLKERVFCAGANIRMLSQSGHGREGQLRKFTNETRNAIEEASASGQRYLTVVNGPQAGGATRSRWRRTGLMVDDGNTAVRCPRCLPAVLPGTGGLTCLVDKRHVRRDRAMSSARSRRASRASARWSGPVG
jgi:benzoyl-CoA-dihydrodiol lyase